MSEILGPHNQRYEDFYAEWTGKQKEQLQELQEALESNMKEDELQKVVSRVQKHYEYYYEAKDRAAQQNVLKIITPDWKSPLERAFQWIGGWRPTMVFQLVYAQAGQYIEAELAEFLDGIDSPTLASLTSKQLTEVSDLQTKTQKEEESLCYRMAILQQSMADQPLLSLAQAEIASGEASMAHDSDGLKNAVDEKLKTLEDLLVDADQLRQSALKGILDILTPLQGAQYLVAAAQLQVAIRQLGEKKLAAEPARNGQSQDAAPFS